MLLEASFKFVWLYVDLENFELDQLIISLLNFFKILVTCLLDIVLTW